MDNRNSHFIKKILILVLLYTTMFLIIFFSKELSCGIKNGINISLNLIIPSMFIFMIFSNIIINSKLKDIIARPFRFLSRHVLKISTHESAILILSLLGGYPIGAKLLSSAVSNKIMTATRAESMLRCCVNCGPAFLISGVGIGLFGNSNIGLYMYLSQIIACLLIAFFFLHFSKDSDGNNITIHTPANISTTSLFVNSVNDSVKSLCVVCGFIVAFCSIMPIITIMLDNIGVEYNYIIAGLLEVTSGCKNVAQLKVENSVLLATAFTAFGGICVHLQICAMLYGTKIKMKKFYLSRVIYVIISVVTVKIFLTIFPQATNCMSYNSSIPNDIYSVSPTATVFMILLAIMLLFFTRKSDRIKSKNLL